MTLRGRLLLALALTVFAIACLTVGLPDYLDAVRQAVRFPGTRPAPAPRVFVVGSIAGLGALAVVLHLQWKRGEVAWMAASILLSHVGVLAYICRTLRVGTDRERPTGA